MGAAVEGGARSRMRRTAPQVLSKATSQAKPCALDREPVQRIVPGGDR